MSVQTSGCDIRPAYDRRKCMRTGRGPLAERFARQILGTCRPFLTAPESELAVLDIGCGYGFTTVELARRCARVVGLEPCESLARHAQHLRDVQGASNTEIRPISVTDLNETEQFDLAVLDNVLEHLPDQRRALERVSAGLKPGGVLFIIVPNKLWPVEVHYGLPFLSYLPLRLANAYLRLSGRGSNYADASYALSYWGVRRLFGDFPEFSQQFVLPADLSLATFGRAVHYRLGAAAIRRFPWLWTISKVFLIVAVKQCETSSASAPPSSRS